jgi:hypothetical protein
MHGSSVAPSTNVRTTMKTKTTPTNEREYDFDLVLSGPDELLELAEPIVDAFFEASGGDCTPGVSRGLPYASCTRRAASLKDAVLAAIADVRKVGHGIEVLRVEWPELVTQAEIARAVGRSRQAVHQYVRGACGPGGFPAPARRSPRGELWRSSDAIRWFCRSKLAPESLVRDAEEMEAINSVLDYTWKAKRHAALVREVNAVVAAKAV